MHVDRSGVPVPEPPSVADSIAAFPVPVAGFVAQPALELKPVASTSSGYDGDSGQLFTGSITLSYTRWWNPDDHGDPVNERDLDPALRATLDAPPVRELSTRSEALRQGLRYPMLWEAVRTTAVGAGRGLPDLAETLIAHVEHLLINRYRETRADPSDQWAVLGRPRPGHLQPGSIDLDGVPRDGLLLDTDADVWAVGVALADRLVTVGVDRDLLDGVDLRLVTVEAG